LVVKKTIRKLSSSVPKIYVFLKLVEQEIGAQVLVLHVEITWAIHL